MEHFEDDDDNNNDSNDVEDVSVHASWITRRHPRQQAILAAQREPGEQIAYTHAKAIESFPCCWETLNQATDLSRFHSAAIPERYDAQLTKYWPDWDERRIHSNCRIHYLPGSLNSFGARIGWPLAAITAATQ